MPTRSLAYFITSHGFGHASRACAVMESVWRLDPSIRFELFTGTPEWFFSHSLDGPFRNHPGVVDVGLVQANSLVEDLDATLKTLRDWIPFSNERIDPLAQKVTELGSEAVLCDIAPLGLAVAKQVGIPGVLIENFTWSWIYEAYVKSCPDLQPMIDALEQVFTSADHHFQTEPCCQIRENATQIGVLSRSPRRLRESVREELGIPHDAPLLLLTMGGIAWDYSAITHRLDALGRRENAPWLLVAGGSSRLEKGERILRLPHQSNFYHPDLIHACDAVIGKLGYSTVAEVAHAGLPFGYVGRSRFRESPVLEAWVVEHLPHLKISGEDLASGLFLDRLDSLLDQIGKGRRAADGGGEMARGILGLF